MSSLKFGTSGLRGLVTELVGLPTYAHVRAFCAMLREDDAAGVRGEVLIGRDLRSSSPLIAGQCAQAIADAGLEPVDCGAVPTPALAQAAMASGRPAVMVTGSHIPDDRNGLKFYRAQGEIDKTDEARILAQHQVGHGACDEESQQGAGAGTQAFGRAGRAGGGQQNAKQRSYTHLWIIPRRPHARPDPAAARSCI